MGQASSVNEKKKLPYYGSAEKINTPVQLNSKKLNLPLSSSPSIHKSNSSPSFQVSSPVIKLAKIVSQKSSSENSIDGVSLQAFLKYVCKNNPVLGEHLYHHMLLRGGKEKQSLRRSDFKEGAQEILNLILDSDEIEYYCRVFARGKENLTEEQTFKLVQTAYQVAMWAHPECNPESTESQEAIQAVVTATMHGKSEVSIAYLSKWIQQDCPRMLVWMHRYVAHQLNTTHRTMKSKLENNEHDQEEVSQETPSTPIVDFSQSMVSETPLHPTFLWLLTCSLPTLYTKPSDQLKSPTMGSFMYLDPHQFVSQMVHSMTPTHWTLLYDSSSQGLSINRFQTHVFQYRGPTVMLIRGEQNQLFCVTCDTEWKESHLLWGGIDCMVIQLLPKYHIVDKGAKLMSANFSIRGYPQGIRVGSDCKSPTLCVDGNFTLVTFQKIPYRLKSIEVWGCGTLSARESQIEVKKWEIKQAEKAKKVNINAGSWGENPDKYLLELAGARQSYANYNEIDGKAELYYI